MWEEELSLLGNTLDDISDSLEREYRLRRFNRQMLKMENIEGSALNCLIGLGTRVDPLSGEPEFITKLDKSYFASVVTAFERLPITKHFGLTIADAMRLPVDQWHEIRRSAETMRDNEPKDQMSDLIEVLKEFIMVRRMEEGE